MKIKLITFAPHTNFGTCLQAYALNYVLRKMGHNVEFIYNGQETEQGIINRCAKRLAQIILPESFIVFIKKHRSQKKNKVGSEKPPVVLRLPNHRLIFLLSRLPVYKRLYKAYKCANLQWRKVYKFTYEDGNFNMRRLYTHRQYDEVAADADLFVTGSDQIWNPYCGGFNPMMFVEFGGDKKRMAYASSISLPELPDSLKPRIRQDLAQFQHIGVREKSSVELLDNLLGRTDVRCVADPTCLLSAEEWEKFGERAVLEFQPPRRYIFCYFVGERKELYEQMVQDAKRFTGINDVITLECYNRSPGYGGGRLYNDAGPYEWVNLLQHSSYVCMDSFHATIFALKFKKDFVHALKNTPYETGSQNTRIYDILERYGLSHKIYVSREKEDWRQPVDYSKVTPFMEREAEDSMRFLQREMETDNYAMDAIKS